MDLAERLRNALGNRYRIVEETGSGGMATVFKAEDLKHGRAVAIKVLRDEVAQSVGADRFLQEIRIVAKLQHPHVLTLLDSGEIDGTLYYVMPFVEGESLRAKLDRERELPVPDALRLLREVADALAFAHENGVVHRDIKPDNVLVSGRHALVADFGVSKALSTATGEDKVTTLGVALGTPAYMAPEQATADGTIDHRADIYALGILGYELLTGRPPFVGTTPQQVLGAQVTETPKTVTELRAAVPEAVSAVLMRCLEKRPADRWQTAEEVRAQFEALQTSSGGITPTGVMPVAAARRPRWQLGLAAAVLVAAVGVTALFATRGGDPSASGERAATATAADPAGRIVVTEFENLTADPSLDPLGRLAASWVERSLTQSAVAQVIPLQQQGGEEVEAARTASPAAVANRFGAELVVTGEYYRRGEDLEVVAHILHPAEERTLYDLQGARGDPQDPMEAFDVVGQQVVGAVANHYQLDWTSSAELYSPPPSLEIFRMATEATTLFGTGRQADAVVLFEEISQRDTTWLGHLIFLSAGYSNADRLEEADSIFRYLDARRDRLTRLEQALLDWSWTYDQGDLEGEYRAVTEMASLDPVGSAYNAALTCSRSNRLEETLEHLSRRDTTNVFGTWGNGLKYSALVRLGRLDEALDFARARRAADPTSRTFLNNEVRALAAMGRRAEVEGLLEEARDLASTSTWSPAEVMQEAARVAASTGHGEDATRYAELALEEAVHLDRPTRFLRGQALSYAGRWEEAVPLLRDLLEDYPESWEYLGHLGWALAGMGDREAAMVIRDRLAALELEFFYPGERMFWMAAISTGLGEHDRTIQELREAVTTGQRFSNWTIWAPWFRPLHDDPRYQTIVAPK
jgi:tRNA A-37 threonylcarbamoyl transferase component Bud32/tetratricopeptide (TPR) repeat protein